jgi:putative Mg2+ transporter-C (MgtC) family protein
VDVILRLILAAVVGGVIGLDRERAHKWAGIRTLLLVCLGSALFTIVSIFGFGDPADPARLAAGIVVGIGFLGAGVILHSEKGVAGLTTAAAVWAVAAVGVAIGCGLYLIALATAILMLVALRLRTKHPHD